MLRTRAVAAVVLMMLGVMPPVRGTVTAGDQDPQVPTFRTSTQAVQLNVIVTDASGNPVAGLTEDDFEIYEERDLRPIVTFKAIDSRAW